MESSIKRIFSLNLICYLRLNGFKEKAVGFNENTKKVFFIYEESEELDRKINNYKDVEAIVKLHDFISEFKTLKIEMYQHSREFERNSR